MVLPPPPRSRSQQKDAEAPHPSSPGQAARPPQPGSAPKRRGRRAGWGPGGGGDPAEYNGQEFYKVRVTGRSRAKRQVVLCLSCPWGWAGPGPGRGAGWGAPGCQNGESRVGTRRGTKPSRQGLGWKGIPGALTPRLGDRGLRPAAARPAVPRPPAARTPLTARTGERPRPSQLGLGAGLGAEWLGAGLQAEVRRGDPRGSPI